MSLPNPSYFPSRKNAEYLQMRNEIERLELENKNFRKRINELEIQSLTYSLTYETMKKHFFDLLEDYECGERWKDSIDHCRDYIERAQFAETHLKRTNNHVYHAMVWLQKEMD